MWRINVRYDMKRVQCNKATDLNRFSLCVLGLIMHETYVIKSFVFESSVISFQKRIGLVVQEKDRADFLYL